MQFRFGARIQGRTPIPDLHCKETRRKKIIFLLRNKCSYVVQVGEYSQKFGGGTKPLPDGAHRVAVIISSFQVLYLLLYQLFKKYNLFL